MCGAADMVETDVVLEIGPGTGVLTREILLRGATVIAIEADLRAISILEQTFPEAIAAGQLLIYHHDARAVDFTRLGLANTPYKVVSNIPYYLSGLLFRQLLDTAHQPTDIIFLIQKELAERIARDPKESLLSLSVKIFGTPTYICTVPKGHFSPPPKVDSAIIKVSHINHDAFGSLDSQAFFALLRIGLGKKRKQLLGNLSQAYPRPFLQAIFAEQGLPVDVRGEDLSVATWRTLFYTLATKG